MEVSHLPQCHDALVTRVEEEEGRGCFVQGITSVLESSLVGSEHPTAGCE